MGDYNGILNESFFILQALILEGALDEVPYCLIYIGDKGRVCVRRGTKQSPAVAHNGEKALLIKDAAEFDECWAVISGMLQVQLRFNSKVMNEDLVPLQMPIEILCRGIADSLVCDP